MTHTSGNGRRGGLTRWQRFNRSLFRVLGPAQTGLPPFATEEERKEYLRGQVAPATPPVAPPPGYRFTTYTDESGVEHRKLEKAPEE